MILTDVIVTRQLSLPVRAELERIGLTYLCEATEEDFRSWMAEAGLIEVTVTDLTSILRPVWEDRWDNDDGPSHQAGYEYLLENPQTSLGKAIQYIYVRGEKPKSPA